MGFLSPWFLLGLAAIGLPIYLHLLRRHVTTPLPFASLMFFERGTQSSTRHRRLRYLLLFALRSALLLLLILAFANPFLRFAGAKTSNPLLLIVVDRSFSMKAADRFSNARQGAMQLVAARPPAQRVQIMALGERLAALTQPEQDAGALRSAVESIQPGDARANLGELAHGIRALVGSVTTPVELHLFSDMQKTSMAANFADMALPPGVHLVLHTVGTASPNWTVESVVAPQQLADVKDPAKARVVAVIAGYGTPAAQRTASLLVNGKVVATHSVQVPKDGRGTVEFQLLDVPYGMNRCTVKIDSADSFPGDDENVFAVKRADPERVLFLHQTSDTRSPLYFGAALAAATQASFILQSIDSDKAADIDPARYAFVVLSDTAALPSIFENALLRHVRSGGNVLVAAGPSVAHHARIPIYGGTATDAHTYARNGFATVSQTDLTHPVLNQAVGKDEAAWSDVKVYYTAGVDTGNARVLAQLNDQTPLLLEKQVGDGHVLLFASGFDNLSNDLPVRPAWVPFVDRTARYLSGSGNLGGSRVVGSSVPLRSGSANAQKGSVGVEILDPDGHRALSLTEAAAAQSFSLTRSGFYQIRSGDGKTSLIGVNPDRRESNLEPIAPDLLQLWGGDSATVPANVDTASIGHKNGAHSIWWYVMLLVLIAAVAESVVASRYLGTQREEA